MGLGINLVSSDPLTSSHSNTDRLQLITLALVTGPYLYQRVSLLQSAQDNAPGKLQSYSAFSSYEVKFADRVHNCEDVILLDGLDGVALLSCDEARDRWNTVMVRMSSTRALSTPSRCPMTYQHLACSGTSRSDLGEINVTVLLPRTTI